MTGNGYESSYLAHGVSGEEYRLRTLEAAFDEATIDVLASLGLPSAADCLELGAGAGSIAAWLAVHRPCGRVTATDIDTRFLRFPITVPVTAVQHDLARDDFRTEAFDLVHTRALLCHLPQRNDILERAARWVRPGGWLVVEDFARFDVDRHPVLQKVTDACESLLATTVGSDLRWALTLPDRLRTLDMEDIGSSTVIGTVGDQSATDEFWVATFEQAVPALIDGGFLTSKDIDDMHALRRDPGFTGIGISLVSAWARKPVAG